MINELNFKNLTIKYDGNNLSKQAIKRVRTAETISCLVIITLFFVVVFIDAFYLAEYNLGFSIFVVAISIITIIYGGSFVSYLLIQRIMPRHYEFITWLMRYKMDEIEIGWFNDKYIIRMFSQGWHMKEFGNFIPEDYYLNDKSDKTKPICMTIDLTKDDIDVIVENQQ